MTDRKPERSIYDGYPGFLLEESDLYARKIVSLSPNLLMRI